MNKLGIFSYTFLLSLAAGCTDPAMAKPETTADASSSSGDDTSTGEAPTTSTSEVSATSDEPEQTDSGALTPDMSIGDGECDPWAQDCPSGYKCMAFAEETEGSFSGNKCTLVVANPAQDGDKCRVEGGWWSGIDNCDDGLACWDINHDTNEGVCVAMCTGSPESPECPGSEFCAFWVSGISHVCLETCDPLIQDCDVGQSCLPEWGSSAEQWVCTAEYSFDEGQEFDECYYSNVCDPGLICWGTTAAIECAGLEDGCCLSLCDLGDPKCNGEGAECTSFYGLLEGEAPPNFKDVGVCVLPG